MKTKINGLLAAALFFSWGCAEQNSTKTVGTEDTNVTQRVIYGDDDRLDLYDVQDNFWLQRAASTVALMNSSSLTLQPNGDYLIRTRAYGPSRNLCQSEPFYEQVTAAFCSGSLIAPDVIMTAGHCIRSSSSCSTTQFVFNFGYQVPGQSLSVADGDDVYSCKELIQSEVSNSSQTDYALIRLDRPVVGRDPLAIRQQGDVQEGTGLTVIGHPSGLPTKVAGGAIVRDNSPQTYFITNLDTYGGNSGSAVFNDDTGVIEGILVRGARDFIFQNGCTVSNVCSEDGCRGEDVTRVSEVLPYIDSSELVSASDGAASSDDEGTSVDFLDSSVRSIPDASVSGVRTAFSTSALEGDLELYVNIRHSWVGDLRVTLQTPSGAVLMVHDLEGGNNDNIEQTYRLSQLEVISQGAADGQWTLMVQDLVRQDVGSLQSWGLSIVQ